MASVLVVEDDNNLCETICEYLSHSGHDVRCCGDIEGLRDAFRSRPAEVVVLDVNLPGEDGFVGATWLRASSKAGVIMLTGRGADEDRFRGRACGADIYMVKPAYLKELEAAVVNLAWRTTTEASPQALANAQPGVWRFDRKGWALAAPNGIHVHLTAAEFKMVSLLAGKPGDSVSRESIMAAFGKSALPVDNRSIDLVLSRLRKKVTEGTGITLPVRAVRGTGYVFTASIEEV